MKSFFQFISEATSTAGQQASRLGLVGDGHGGWYDKRGEFVAKTEKGKLKFYNKRQKIGQQDPAQTDKEKRLSHTTYDKGVQAEPAPQQQAAPEQPAGQQQLAPDDPEAPARFDAVPDVPKTKGTLTVAFGRFNPPTIGHEKLFNKLAKESEDGNYIIVPSRSHNKKKDPLDFNTKIDVMRKMYPDHTDRIIDNEGYRTIFDILRDAHMNGYANVNIVAGGKRVGEFDKLANEYNGKLGYQFDKLDVASAGDRDEGSADPIEAMSASVQRNLATENDFESFYGNYYREVPKVDKDGEPILDKDEKPVTEFLPIIDRKTAKEIFKSVRKGLKLEEGWNLWEIAPKLDWKNLRENYVKKNIFNIGQLVENLNTGLVGRIIRRGTNYLICVTEDNIMFKSWIQDIDETTKQPMKNVSSKDRKYINARSKNLFKKDVTGEKIGVNETKKNQNLTDVSGVPANQREIGTDAHRKYVETMVPGSSWGRQFINKYRKK